ncbi:MAG: histidine kinase, partial [Opitutus sp.]|nr:histidine kinase [Opitutus sp.]
TSQGQLIITTWRDLSERKSLEDQLRQSQKMEVIGQLAGGIAHDFNNILTAMTLNIELLEKSCVLPPDARQFTAELGSTARRATKLTEQLVMFARRQAMQVRPLDLNAALQNLLGMLHRLLGEQIVIRRVGAGQPLWIEGDAGMLDHAIINLCLNARDAMPGGGTLTLGTLIVEISPDELARRPEAAAGAFVCLSVTDTGHGMSPETLAHVFEPFFTTKEIGRGTGLGLASVHGIVHQHHGWVEVESVLQRGSTFRLYLPATRSPADETPPPPPAPTAAAPRHACVLLVEDEEVVREVSETVLKTFGYRVLAATDATEALALWAKSSAEIDLLLTDMRMPGPLNGLQLSQRLLAEKPSLKTIIMSGYSAEIMHGLELPTTNLRFLSKPFRTEALLKSIDESLG